MEQENSRTALARADFPTELCGLRLPALLERAEGIGVEEARRSLSQTPLTLEGAAALLQAPAEPLIDELVECACAATRRSFSGSVRLFAPCYLSSFCVNHCRYCGFNFTMPTPRRWLSPARALEEIRFLAKRGFRRLLLVAGESPAIVSPQYLEEIVIEARTLVPEVDLEVAPARDRDYERWSRAGAGGVVCYQETYDPPAYAYLHPRGPKMRYPYRLGTLERAARGGMDRLGLGVLLGLAEPKLDVLSLIAHALWLGRTFPDAKLSLSLPRLCPAVPSFRAGWHVEDEEMLRLFAVLRLAVPAAELVVTTREPEWLRMRLLRAGITRMSAESVTVPGAYVECGHDGGQFEVKDHRTADEVRWDIEDLGYEVR